MPLGCLGWFLGEGLAGVPSSGPPQPHRAASILAQAPLRGDRGPPLHWPALHHGLGVHAQGPTVPGELCPHLHAGSSPFSPVLVQDVAGLLVTHISNLFFPQGDVGHEGEEGVPGEAGRRVNGSIFPTESGGRHGAAAWSPQSPCRGAWGCWGLSIPEGGSEEDVGRLV